MSAEPIRAAGGVLWRPGPGGGVQVALVHRPRYDDWSLPKGKLEPGEPAVLGAHREVLEETGFGSVVGRSLGRTRYDVVMDGRQMPKTVRWWALSALDGLFVPGAEVDELAWLSPDRAARKATSGQDVETLRRFTAGPADTTTVLLLRHGSAGERATWQGDDRDRPLDEAGREQARAACAVLPVYGPRRLLAAPLARCTETLRPLADRTGLPVEPDPVFAADDGGADPQRVVRRLRELGRAGVPVVVCTQRGVVPDVVGLLAAEDDVAVDRLRARKGSLWALAFDRAGRLVDADHAPDLTG